MKTHWLNRELIGCHLHICLCVTVKDFHRELTKMGVDRDDWPPFVNAGADGTTHYFDSTTSRGHVAIVCINVDPKRSGIEVAGLLVHEAIHIWQEHLRLQGESAPSSEYEAYSIQTISQRLMWSYSDQVSTCTESGSK